jgi:Pentapeptide repeats (8 copies)
MTNGDRRGWPRLWSFLWRVLVVVVTVALFAVVWWRLPLALYSDAGGGPDAENARLRAVTDTRTAMLAGLIGVGAILTFWLNSRIYKVTAETFELTRLGHLTERYSKAIEQLGGDNLDVRLGGIYALERLAIDSAGYHPTIVEVLSAFVREHGDRDQVGDDPRPAADVQAALTVLGRLPNRPGVSRGDLSNAQLAGAHLDGADLSGARLSGVNLSNAWLGDTNLSDAFLGRANLSGARILYGSDLSGAWLGDANLSGAWLGDAQQRDGEGYGDATLPTVEGKATSVAGLTQEQLSLARGDEHTRLPPGLDHPSGWRQRRD